MGRSYNDHHAHPAAPVALRPPALVRTQVPVLRFQLARIPRRRRHATVHAVRRGAAGGRSEEHTSELQSLMRISYAVFCLKKKKHNITNNIIATLHCNHTNQRLKTHKNKTDTKK